MSPNQWVQKGLQVIPIHHPIWEPLTYMIEAKLFNVLCKVLQTEFYSSKIHMLKS